MIDLEDMTRVVMWMREMDVQHMKTPEFEFSLGWPRAPGTGELPKPVPVEIDGPPPVACKCGHDLDADHNEFGCLHGCPETSCWREEDLGQA